MDTEEVEEPRTTHIVSSITTEDGVIVGPGNEVCTYCREALHTFVKKGPRGNKIYLCDACQWEQTAPYFVRRGVSELDWSGPERRMGETTWEVVRRKDGVVVGSRKRADRAYAVCGMMNAGHSI